MEKEHHRKIKIDGVLQGIVRNQPRAESSIHKEQTVPSGWFVGSVGLARRQESNGNILEQKRYLSGLGRCLDVGDAVAAGELLCLPRVNCPSWQVTLITHKHHGYIVRVLHSFDLFPAGKTCKVLNGLVKNKMHKWRLSYPFLKRNGH